MITSNRGEIFIDKDDAKFAQITLLEITSEAHQMRIRVNRIFKLGLNRKSKDESPRRNKIVVAEGKGRKREE